MYRRLQTAGGASIKEVAAAILESERIYSFTIECGRSLVNQPLSTGMSRSYAEEIPSLYGRRCRPRAVPLTVRENSTPTSSISSSISNLPPHRSTEYFVCANEPPLLVSHFSSLHLIY